MQFVFSNLKERDEGSMTDAGYTDRMRQPQRGERQPTFLAMFCRKLQEIEKKMSRGTGVPRSTLDPPIGLIKQV